MGKKWPLSNVTCHWILYQTCVTCSGYANLSANMWVYVYMAWKGECEHHCDYEGWRSDDLPGQASSVLLKLIDITDWKAYFF